MKNDKKFLSLYYNVYSTPVLNGNAQNTEQYNAIYWMLLPLCTLAHANAVFRKKPGSLSRIVFGRRGGESQKLQVPRHEIPGRQLNTEIYFTMTGRAALSCLLTLTSFHGLCHKRNSGRIHRRGILPESLWAELFEVIKQPAYIW